MTDELPLLWQMRTSIFCEKARWALDYKELAHRRRELVPGLHSTILRLSGRGTTVPVLDVGGRSARGSSQINAVLEEARPEPALYPPDGASWRQVVDLEAYFDEIGHEVRRVLLDPILRNPPLMTQTVFAYRPRLERWITRAMHPLTERVTRRQYGIDRERADRARARVLSAFDEIDARLRSSGYLVTDQFTVADLAGAALLAPLVMPAEYPDAPWKAGPYPAELTSLRDSLAERPGGQWVLEMYRRHRGRSAELG